MKFSNNEGDRSLMCPLWSSNKASSTGTGLNLIELLAKGSPGTPETTHAIAKLLVVLHTLMGKHQPSLKPFDLQW